MFIAGGYGAKYSGLAARAHESLVDPLRALLWFGAAAPLPEEATPPRVSPHSSFEAVCWHDPRTLQDFLGGSPELVASEDKSNGFRFEYLRGSRHSAVVIYPPRGQACVVFSVPQ